MNVWVIMNKAIEVLLIEDNPADAYLACEYLNDTGFSVSVTKLQDGKAAIDYFEQVYNGTKEMPDLVLLDLNLPKQNGQEVLEFIRSHDQNVTVVIYSGSTSPLDRQRAENSSVNGYLVKPMTGNEMDEVVFQLKKVLTSIGGRGQLC
jgi:CheY-like chemotaxis protein